MQKKTSGALLYPRPRVSNHNAYVESLFRTAKYWSEYSASGFASLNDARAWADCFVRWYKHDRRPSAIRYVDPAQRHAREEAKILAGSRCAYEAARATNPAVGGSDAKLLAYRSRHAEPRTR
mgnify:CR=1 FL=1